MEPAEDTPLKQLNPHTRLAVGKLYYAFNKGGDVKAALRGVLVHLASLESHAASLETAAVVAADATADVPLMRSVIWHGQFMNTVRLKPLRLRCLNLVDGFDTSLLRVPPGFELLPLEHSGAAAREHFCTLVILPAKVLKEKLAEILLRLAMIRVNMTPYDLCIVAIHPPEHTHSLADLANEPAWKSPLVMAKQDPRNGRPKLEKDYTFSLVHMFTNPLDERAMQYNQTFLVYHMTRLFDAWARRFPAIVMSK